ncbi:uncharacterized protein [Watersipora subatra]|uniref:uncharacterized protein n=1 Tax=Watersipora subatra TaxID=2589382 RepID=UPI00355B7776
MLYGLLRIGMVPGSVSTTCSTIDVRPSSVIPLPAMSVNSSTSSLNSLNCSSVKFIFEISSWSLGDERSCSGSARAVGTLSNHVCGAGGATLSHSDGWSVIDVKSTSVKIRLAAEVDVRNTQVGGLPH